MKTKEQTKSAFDGVKKVGDDVLKMGRSVWLAGLGVVAYADEEGRGLVGKLVDRGESFEKSDRNVVGRKVDAYSAKAKDMGREVGDRVQGTFQSVMHRAGVPTSDEIHTLIQRVETLTSKVEKMQQKAS
jgi:poly(hydroxyalkanoate) granule-associated protein